MSEKLFQLLAVLYPDRRVSEQEVHAMGFSNWDMSDLEQQKLICSTISNDMKCYFFLGPAGKEAYLSEKESRDKDKQSREKDSQRDADQNASRRAQKKLVQRREWIQTGVGALLGNVIDRLLSFFFHI